MKRRGQFSHSRTYKVKLLESNDSLHFYGFPILNLFDMWEVVTGADRKRRVMQHNLCSATFLDGIGNNALPGFFVPDNSATSLFHLRSIVVLSVHEMDTVVRIYPSVFDRLGESSLAAQYVVTLPLDTKLSEKVTVFQPGRASQSRVRHQAPPVNFISNIR